MKKISVIVPVYNIEEYLERTLESLVNQTYKNLEIILINDGSTDSSKEICDKYKKKDKRVVVIHKDNEGVSIARNKGLELATGDFIGFVDSDDVISLDMYEILYKNIINTSADISVCNFKTFSKDIDFEYNKNIKIFKKKEALEDIISDGIITNFLWNKLFKKDIFNNIKFPEKKIYEDLYVMPKLIEKIEILCFDYSKLYGYFKRENSYVNTYNKEKNKNYLEFCDGCYKYLSKYKYLNNYLENYRCFYIYSAFLQCSKSKCIDIINSNYMNEYYKIFKKNFKYLNNKVSLKRKVLFYILYINKNIFYKIVSLLN